MFTGIVEEVGLVSESKTLGVDQIELTINSQKILEDVKCGDSIAVEGVCLTVTEFSQSKFKVQLSKETVKKTKFNKILPGTKVNLERALTLATRLGGHLVQGHVDGVSNVTRIKNQGDFWVFSFAIPVGLSRYMIPKGSICINGISLTIAELGQNDFSVAVIPVTYQETTLQYLQDNSTVHLEVDMVGKYIESLFPDQKKFSEKQISSDWIREKGW